MNAQEWDLIIQKMPEPHILQTWEWGEVKAVTGWQSFPQQWGGQAAALVLERSPRLLKIGPQVRVLYSPRGPMVNWEDRSSRTAALSGLMDFAKQRKALFIKIDPEFILSTGIPGAEDESINSSGELVQQELRQSGWRYSSDQIQFRNTVWLDLQGGEENWLERMKQKTRYNLRLAQKKDVVVRIADESEFPLLYRMYQETSVRDGFVIRPQSYYIGVWQKFISQNLGCALIAEVEGEPVAGLVELWFGQRAWYMYGMSTNKHREKMPAYLLQWEAMRQASLHGCTNYDLWGAPEVFDESDSMWGVYRFKEGLGGKVIRTLGAWDYPVYPGLYSLYTRILPRILDIMRRQGKAKTSQEVSV
ncbi:MAG TPA: peptidoglycan bridge formation glycyltransferase FemA/FemB family protein [Longilinea sp.]|nr:peptidoglycan bridge formation glycyltransferase FemA/FemB family protein [Longilinea sp.]